MTEQITENAGFNAKAEADLLKFMNETGKNSREDLLKEVCRVYHSDGNKLGALTETSAALNAMFGDFDTRDDKKVKFKDAVKEEDKVTTRMKVFPSGTAEPSGAIDFERFSHSWYGMDAGDNPLDSGRLGTDIGHFTFHVPQSCDDQDRTILFDGKVEGLSTTIENNVNVHTDVTNNNFSHR